MLGWYVSYGHNVLYLSQVVFQYWMSEDLQGFPWCSGQVFGLEMTIVHSGDGLVMTIVHHWSPKFPPNNHKLILKGDHTLAGKTIPFIVTNFIVTTFHLIL